MTSIAPELEAPRSVLTSIRDVLATSAVSRGVGIVRGLVIAKILAPETYGVSTTVAIALAYSQFLDLGTANAAFREAAAARGRDDTRAAFAAVGHIGVVRLFAGGGLALSALLLLMRGDLGGELREALRFLPFIALPATLVIACQLHLQAFGRIRDVNVTTTIAAMIDLAVGIPLTVLAGLRGLLVGLLISQAVAVGWAITRLPGPLTARMPRAVLVRYLRIGLPIAFLGIVDHHLVYIDHLMVLAFFSVRELGIYNIALIASDSLRLVTLAMVLVIRPRMISAYARSGGRVDAIRPHTLTPVRLSAATVPFMILPMWVAGTYLIGHYYPAYRESIRPMQLLLASYYFLTVTGGVTTFLFAIDRYTRVLFFLIPALVLNVMADIVFVRAGFGLLAIAMGSAVTYILYGAALLGYVGSHFGLSRREWTTILLDAAAPGVYLVAVLALVEQLPYRESIAAASATVLLGWALLAPLAWRAKRFARALNECQ